MAEYQQGLPAQPLFIPWRVVLINKDGTRQIVESDLDSIKAMRRAFELGVNMPVRGATYKPERCNG